MRLPASARQARRELATTARGRRWGRRDGSWGFSLLRAAMYAVRSRRPFEVTDERGPLIALHLSRRRRPRRRHAHRPPRPAAGSASDIHCHVHVPAADEMVKHVTQRRTGEPNARFSSALSRETNRKQMENVRACLTNVDQRLRDMDKMGVDVQAISPSPFHFMYWLEPDLARKMSRAVNEHLAGIVQAHPDRFVALRPRAVARRRRPRPRSWNTA